MRKFLFAPMLLAVLGAFFSTVPGAAQAATRPNDPQVLAIVPASANATCFYRLDTTHNGVTITGKVRPCAPQALQHTLLVAESVAKAHQWSYLPTTVIAGSHHPDGSVRFGPTMVTPAPTPMPQAGMQSCPMNTAIQAVAPNCGGGGGGGNPPCNYFQNLWTWAKFDDGGTFSANVAYTVNCGALMLNWSQIGQFGGYQNHYTLAGVDYNWITYGFFWQAIPHSSYLFQPYGKWAALGGAFVFATVNSNNWTDWDWVNMGNLW